MSNHQEAFYLERSMATLTLQEHQGPELSPHRSVTVIWPATPFSQTTLPPPKCPLPCYSQLHKHPQGLQASCLAFSFQLHTDQCSPFPGRSTWPLAQLLLISVPMTSYALSSLGTGLSFPLDREFSENETPTPFFVSPARADWLHTVDAQ